MIESYRSAMAQMQALMRGLEIENTRLRQRVDAMAAEAKERAGEPTPLRSGQHAALLLRIADLESCSDHARRDSAAALEPIATKARESVEHLDRIRERLWQLHERMLSPWHARLAHWARHLGRSPEGVQLSTVASALDIQIDRLDFVTDHLIELGHTIETTRRALAGENRESAGPGQRESGYLPVRKASAA